MINSQNCLLYRPTSTIDSMKSASFSNSKPTPDYPDPNLERSRSVHRICERSRGFKRRPLATIRSRFPTSVGDSCCPRSAHLLRPISDPAQTPNSLGAYFNNYIKHSLCNLLNIKTIALTRKKKQTHLHIFLKLGHLFDQFL